MLNDATFVAVAFRSPFLAVAVIGSGEVLEVLRSRAQTSSVRHERLRAVLDGYAARRVVVEPGSEFTAGLCADGFEVAEISMSTVIARLLPDHPRPRHADLFAHLLERHPSLRRLMRFPAGRDRFSTLDRWRNVTMLPIAMGIACRFGARTRPASSPKKPRTSDTLCAPSSSDGPRPVPNDSSTSSATTSGTPPTSL